MVIKSAQTRQELLATLASMTNEEIDSIKLHGTSGLRSIVSQLGYNSIERDGIQVRLDRSRKQELLDILKSEIEVFNKASVPTPQSQIPTASETVEVIAVALEKAPYWREKLTKIWQSNVNEDRKHEGAESLGVEIARAVDLAYPDDIYMSRTKQRVNRQSELFTALYRLCQKEDSRSLVALWATAKESANKVRRGDSVKADRVYREKVAEVNAAPIKVTGWRAMVDWAANVLSQLRSDSDRTYHWKRVTIALAVVSGRRMNEILCECTKWEATDDGLIRWDELSKSDKRNVEAPVIGCDARDVERAIAWLRSENGALSKAPKVTKEREDVNKNFGSKVNAETAKVIEEVGLLEDLSVWKFHSFRKLYTLIVFKKMTEEEGLSEYDAIRKASYYMGHSSSDVTNDIYKGGFTLG